MSVPFRPAQATARVDAMQFRPAKDCLTALRTASQGGVVAGGGRALAECASTSSDTRGADDTERRGVAIVADAVAEVAERCGSSAAPDDLALTVDGYGRYLLFMDEHGRVFGADEYLQLSYWGDCGEDLLEITMGRRGTFRPVDHDDRVPLGHS